MKPAAAYQRDYRARQARGALVVAVELDESDIETLIEARVLDARRDHWTREALSAAVKAFLQISRYA
jgi:hypothetical protein